MRYTTLSFMLLMPVLPCIHAFAQNKPAATEIVQKSQEAFYYSGNDMKSNVTMELITADGKKRTRVLTMLRRNDPGTANQKYFLYFHEPGDVRRMAFLVWKYPEKDDDRWIFIPAVNMVRRVAAKDSRSSFVGSDFTYEDISGRDVPADTHTLLREERLGDADCYVIQSVPKAATEYTKKLAWIDKKTFLPLKEEYYDAQNQLARLFTADKIENVAGQGGKKSYQTATKRTMKNVKSGHRTDVTITRVAYDIGLDDGIFSERSLQNPPQQWIK
ncbi:MAG: outer membrane lipoprotein-sorting protein [Acidobacteria bacterium]|nr:outer membrane lipoprotein-sorting protein [Acidobacteriota bacterium]